MSPHAKFGLSLASALGLIIVGCSWSPLNLDATQESSATRHNARERRRHIFDDSNVYVRHPPTYVQTVSPGDHTGVARYDTARLDSTPYVRYSLIFWPDDRPQRLIRTFQRDRLTDFAASVLPVPSGYWSIFALVSADDPTPTSHRALSWMRRTIVPAVAGSLADVHNSNLPPPDADINDALRQVLARLDDDVNPDVRTAGYPSWARQVSPEQSPSPPSTLLAFFDSESRVLRVANAGAGRAFLGRRVGKNNEGDRHECRELARSSAPRYFPLKDDAQTCARDVEELVGGDVYGSRGALDVTSVEVESVEVRDGDFLVLGPHGTWAHLNGEEAVQSVSEWMQDQGQEQERERGESPPPGRLARAGHWPQDPFFDFPLKDHEDLGLGLVHTMIPDLFRDLDEMFISARENVAGRVLRSAKADQAAEGSGANDQDRYTSVDIGHLTPSSK
jgi:hypothetical protein